MSGEDAGGPDTGPDAGAIWAALLGSLAPAAPGPTRDGPGGWRVALPGAEVPVSLGRSAGMTTATATLPEVARVVTGEGPDDAAALAALALDIARSGRTASLLAPGEASPTEGDRTLARPRPDRRVADGLRGVCEAAGLPFGSPDRALSALAARLGQDAEEIAGLRAQVERAERARQDAEQLLGLHRVRCEELKAEGLALRAELERVGAAHVNAANRRGRRQMRCEELEAEVGRLRGGADRARAAALEAIREAERSVLAFDPAAEPPCERLARCGWQPCDAGRTLWRHPLFRGGEEAADVARALAVCASWGSLG